jgi:SPX domain protein involved in polyphosphate accumulation
MRKEEKFILSLSKADDIQYALRCNLQFSEFNRSGDLTEIRTTYLENDNFLIYKTKKNRIDKRYKIRIREYGKNGHFGPLIWVELKEKVYGQGYKNRFRINRDYLCDFLAGKNVFPSVKLDNPEVDYNYLIILYQRIQDLIVKENFYPRLLMQYERLALQGKDDAGLRLTFDYNLRSGLLNRNDCLFSNLEESARYDESKAIVELKIGTQFPLKSDEFKEYFSLHRQGFSKYIFGIESFYSSFHKKPLDQYQDYIPISKIIKFDNKSAV